MTSIEKSNKYAHNILEFISGCENELISTQDITDESKLMYPAFQQAEKALKGILKSTESYHEKSDTLKSSCDGSAARHRDSLLYGYANNIIGFFGSRGQGKTSTMLSFSNALAANGTGCPRDKKLFGERRFYVIPPIDPTVLNADDSVLTIVLSHLLRKVEEKWHMSCTHSAENSATWQIMETIRRCQNGILQKDHRNQDNSRKKDLQDLSRDADVMNIKGNLCKVIEYFFELLGWDTKTSMIVIQLDDTDMKFDNAYAVLEDVRRYLSIPNTVVLMASYLKQLRNLVAYEFEKITDDYVNKFDSSTHMAAKYIDKLIPPPHMVFLPSVEKLIEANFKPKVTRSKDKDAPQKNLETYIFEQIYQKTGMVFISHRLYAHDLIPTTLRGLATLVRLLEDMPQPRDMAQYETDINAYCQKRLEHARQKLQNLIRFESYFMNDWTTSRLTTSAPLPCGGNISEHRDILKALEHSYPNTRMFLAIKLLERHTRESGSPAHKEIKKIYDKIQKERLNSEFPRKDPKTPIYIRLLRALQMLETDCVSDEEYRFPCSLRIFFAIQLNKQAMLDEIEFLQEFLRNAENQATSGDGEERWDGFPTICYDRLSAMMTHYDSYFDENRSGREKATYDGTTKSIRDCFDSDNNKNYVWNKTDKWLTGQEFLIKNLSHLLRIDLEYNKKVQENIHNIFFFYDYLKFLCCNWDVQHQFFENIRSVELKERANEREEENSKVCEALFGSLCAELDKKYKSAGRYLEDYRGKSFYQALNKLPFANRVDISEVTGRLLQRHEE